MDEAAGLNTIPVSADEGLVGSTIQRAARLLRRDEAGFGLIEVLVSAMLVTFVASGVYLGLDASSRTSGTNKHRSIATGLAQQDQDRMRAMTVGELSNYRETQTTTVGTVTYTIVSRADWTTDGTGTASCTSGVAKANYLRISSAVTWPSMTIAPIAVESLVAPPVGSFGSGEGSLAVQVRDHNGAGLAGTTVTLSGARNYTDVTNADGCVLWGYLPVGSYTVSIAKAGYIDPAGVAAPTRAVDVVGAATTTAAFDYDVGGQIDARYQTWDGRAVVATSWTSFTAVNPGLPITLPIFGGAAATGHLSSTVYPFTVGYGVWAGNCAGADPLVSRQASQSAVVAPGGRTIVNLRLPPVNLQVVDGARNVNRATVKPTGTGAGCGVLPTRTTDSTGFITERPFPYGTYSTCVEGVNSRSQTVYKLQAVDNNTPNGTSTIRVDISTGTTRGRCP